MNAPNTIKDKAIKDGLCIVTIGLDGRYAGRAGFEFIGPAYEEEVDLIEECYKKLLELRRKNKASGPSLSQRTISRVSIS